MAAFFPVPLRTHSTSAFSRKRSATEALSTRRTGTGIDSSRTTTPVASTIPRTMRGRIRIPPFAKLFASFGSDLPWPTRLLIASSSFTAEAWPWLQPRDFELELVEVTPGTFEVGGVEVTAVPIRHTAQSLGYRLRDGDAAVAFSGDADTCDELVELARGSDVFVCDCASPDGQKLDGHLTPRLAAEHAERAGAARLLLTHFYPVCDGHDLVAAAAAHFGGEVLAATDLMTLDCAGR